MKPEDVSGTREQAPAVKGLVLAAGELQAARASAGGAAEALRGAGDGAATTTGSATAMDTATETETHGGGVGGDRVHPTAPDPAESESSANDGAPIPGHARHRSSSCQDFPHVEPRETDGRQHANIVGMLDCFMAPNVLDEGIADVYIVFEDAGHDLVTELIKHDKVQ